MPKTNRAYKSAKRNKELDRQKKREEKRKRRLAAKSGTSSEDSGTPAEDGGDDGIVPKPDENPDEIIPRD